jgi:hypothetical protein
MDNATVYKPQQHKSLFTAQIYTVFCEENLEDTFQLISIETDCEKKIKEILNQ